MNTIGYDLINLLNRKHLCLPDYFEIHNKYMDSWIAFKDTLFIPFDRFKIEEDRLYLYNHSLKHSCVIYLENSEILE